MGHRDPKAWTIFCVPRSLAEGGAAGAQRSTQRCGIACGRFTHFAQRRPLHPTLESRSWQVGIWRSSKLLLGTVESRIPPLLPDPASC